MVNHCAFFVFGFLNYYYFIFCFKSFSIFIPRMRQRREKQNPKLQLNKSTQNVFSLVLYKSFIFFLFCRSGTVFVSVLVSECMYAFSAHPMRHLQSTCQIFLYIRDVSNAREKIILNPNSFLPTN